MHNINFSKQIYEKNVFEVCTEVLKKMQTEVTADQTYRIDVSHPISPEIPAVLLKFGFDLSIFLSDHGDIRNSLFICCKKDGKEGVIKKISNAGPPNEKKAVEYRKAIQEYMDSQECKQVLKKIEDSLG